MTERSYQEPSNQPLEARSENRSQRPNSQAFREFIASGWQQTDDRLPALAEAAPHARARRAALSKLFPGDRLVIPAGPLVVRTNDTDHRFRPHSAFAYLTGLGTDQEPDAVLVLDPAGESHEATLYFRPAAGKDSEEFYADARYGELWVGARPTLAHMEAVTGLKCAHVAGLADALAKDALPLRLVPGVDPDLSALVEALRAEQEAASGGDAGLAEALAELRLVKDQWEIGQLQAAVDATRSGFEDTIRAFGRATAHRRGERVLEGAFAARAREDGNFIGYETIAAAGNNANTLHWIANDGAVREGDLVLLDAGVELDSLYTGDITRTLPVSGKFTEPQARVYQAVLDALEAAYAVAQEIREDGSRPRYREMHEAAMRVIARNLAAWGMLPVSAEESLAPEGQYHRRWMVHGTGHHLGLDVHDCAAARREKYLDGELAAGMVFTIEPGLYFREDDLLVPEELRGIGVRVEDNVVLTATGARRLSEDIPRTIAAVEAWVQGLRARR